ncbi:MAG TPA: ATP-binding cassette domain-containing protein [Pirellulales bacterium]|jgi:ABC-type multidrug transport system ATPase subunit|nr:ATP-binding cassette domain-containing protein [Pirellulales bacterium]
MKKNWILGSGPGCDLVLDDSHISGRHCQLTEIEGAFQLLDLGSTNGTLVNGQRIAGPVPLRPGDCITLGRFELKLTAEGRLTKRQFHGELTIEARNVSVDVPQRRLIDDISLTIFPSEFVGLMGPSGAGKTTLTSALNGYLPPSTGQVLINGHDLYAEYARFRGMLGYVPQDDIMHRELTVRQALRFTAELRLPPGTPRHEIDARIAKVLKQLDLESTADTIIGSPERQGISGGQRKRVNLAMELLTDPAVLFLDEPTSGLSSHDALTVMTLLRQLANSGKSILLTIHQPSLEAFRLLDNLAIISRDSQSHEPGRLVYYGPAYPEAIDFFNPQRWQGTTGDAGRRPDDVLNGLAQRPTAEWDARYQKSRFRQAFVTARSGRQVSTTAAETSQPAGCDPLQQWFTLVRRAVALKIADRWNTAILLVQAPIVAVLVILAFGSNARQKITSENWLETSRATAVTLFVLGLSALWFGCSNAVREIVGEWAVYRRERMVNLQLPPYVMSKFVVSGALCVLQCTILLLAARLGCGLRGPLLSSLLIMLLTAGTGVGLGLMVSALARSQEVAIALLPLVLIPMVIFGGTLIPVHNMQVAIRPLAYLMPSRYGFEAMLLAEAARRPLGPSPYSNSIAVDHNTADSDRPDMAQMNFPRNSRLGITSSVAALGILLGVLIVGLHLILRYRDVH